MFVAVGKTMVRCSQIDVVYEIKTSESGMWFSFDVKIRSGEIFVERSRSHDDAKKARAYIINQCGIFS